MFLDETIRLNKQYKLSSFDSHTNKRSANRKKNYNNFWNPVQFRYEVINNDTHYDLIFYTDTRYRVNERLDRKESTLIIQTRTVKKEFIKQLGKYFKTFVQDFFNANEKDVAEFFTAYSFKALSNMCKGIDVDTMTEYFDKHDTFGSKEIVEFLAMINANTTVDEVLDNYVKLFNSFDKPVITDDNYMYYVFPGFYHIDVNLLAFVMLFYRKDATVNDYISLYKVYSVMLKSVNTNTTILKDYNYNVVSDLKKVYKDLELYMNFYPSLLEHHKSVSSLDNLMLKDFYRLFSYLFELSHKNSNIQPLSYNKHYTDFIHNFFNAEVYTFANINEMYNMLVEKSDAGNTRSSHYRYFYNLMFDSLESFYSPDVALLYSYIEKSKVIDVDTIYYLFHNFISYHFGKDKMLLGVVHDKLGTLNFVETFTEIEEYDINNEQWTNYLTNLDEYKDMPISWWIDLV